MSDQQFDACLDLLRRTDPRKTTENLNSICKACPDLAEDLLSAVDQPLTTKTDEQAGKPFLCCDYNRDGDSYRSPFSNKYYPALDDGLYPPANIRQLEELANTAFDSYREMYYEGGLQSTYLWEQEDSFAGVVLFQKKQNQSKWDSIHVFEVEPNGPTSTYKLTSTIILDIQESETSLSGNLTRQLDRQFRASNEVDHIKNLGTLVEELENRMRALLHEVYFGKTKDIIGDIRSITNVDELRAEQAIEQQIARGLN